MEREEKTTFLLIGESGKAFGFRLRRKRPCLCLQNSRGVRHSCQFCTISSDKIDNGAEVEAAFGNDNASLQTEMFVWTSTLRAWVVNFSDYIRAFIAVPSFFDARTDWGNHLQLVFFAVNLGF